MQSVMQSANQYANVLEHSDPVRFAEKPWLKVLFADLL
jgi:hypothetical protein